MTLKKGFKTLLQEAEAQIDTMSASEANETVYRADVVLVDIRDVRELEREGQIPGAIHAPRGMLEFWVDPESPYFKPVFGGGKKFVLYCQSGWRSTLATAIEGGFDAWKQARLPVEPYTR